MFSGVRNSRISNLGTLLLTQSDLFIVFMGVCFLGAGGCFFPTWPMNRPILTYYRVFAACTLLLPEVRGRDPDAILAEEQRQKRAL